MITKGAILSGGYGKRLYPYTKDIPKTMLEIRNGMTILDLQLYDFKRAGIDKVYLLVGYKKEVIENKYGNHWNGINIEYLEEEQPMGSHWAIKNLFEHDNSNFILRNGDTICDADPSELISKTEKNKKLMGLVASKMVSPYGILDIKGRTVINFREKPVLNHYINSGFYYLRKEIAEFLEENYKEKEIERTIFPKLARMGEIYALKHSGLWKSVDSIKDYEEILELFSKRSDYDFGYVMDNSIMIYSGKTLNLSGDFVIILKRGTAKIGNDRMLKEKEYKIKGEITISSITQIYLTYGGRIENW